MLGAATLGDLGVVGERDAIARRELEPLGVVALHEPLAETVSQDPALAAHRLRDERAGRLLRIDHAGRVELHELHVAQPTSRERGEPHRIAGVLVAARRRAAPDPRVAARSEDDRVGHDEPPAAVVDAEPVGAEDAPVVDEQPRDEDVVAHLHGDGQRTLDEDALDLAAGVVAGEARPPVAVGSEEALRQPPVVLTCEPGAPAHEVVDRPRRFPGEDLDARRIGEPVALAQRVGRVLLPAVLGIHRPERGVDPAGGEHRVRVVAAALADAEHLYAALRELDRRLQAGGAGADDEDARRHPPLLCPHAHRPPAR